MRTSSRFAALAALCAVGAILVASAASAAPTWAPAQALAQYTLKIKGIDRAGKAVAIQPSVFGASNGVDYLTYLSSVTVPAGTYVVAAAVPEPGQNSGTLVAKMITVRSDVTVTLSAVKSVLVDATLSGLPTGVTQANQQAMLCVRLRRAFVPVTGMLIVPTLVDGNAAPGTVYVKPMSGRGLRFVYQTYYPAPGTFYEEAGADNGGIPPSPQYDQSVSGMAQVQVELRANENPTPLRNVVESYDGCGSLMVPEETLPASYADYRTPGEWQTQLNFGASKIALTRILTQAGTYLAGHVYAEVLGSAVAGPRADFPVIDGAKITFAPRGIFADPLVSSTDCEGRGRVSLAPSGGSSLIQLCGKDSTFTGRPRSAGWYTLTAAFTRPSTRGVLLSTSVTLSWHFRYAPVTGHAADLEAAPVTVTEFRPAGLGPSNDAAGGSTTTLQVYVLRGGGQAVPTPRYRLTSVQVQVSFNDGRSWHALALQSNSGGWITTIANPVTGGYVALRSIVTDAHGDKTVETVTRAYLVDAG